MKAKYCCKNPKTQRIRLTIAKCLQKIQTDWQISADPDQTATDPLGALFACSYLYENLENNGIITL